MREIVREHVGSTHAHADVLRAADTLVRLLAFIQKGYSVREAIAKEAQDWISVKKIENWLELPDEFVVRQHFSPACYILEAMPASLYLTWKYHNDFSAGIIANAHVGGDNCHRGVVLGSILGLACGVPLKLLSGLKQPPPC